jgi:hypothetical protein
MADTSDCENALVVLCDAILYSLGDSNASITGVPMRIYRGTPNSEQLDADLASGYAHVTILSRAGFSRLTGGYLDNPQGVPTTPTLTVTVAGNVVTIGGTPGAGQLVGVVVNGRAYAYACTGSDTLATTATALAALASAGGGAITDTSGAQIAGLDTEGAATASGAAITFSTSSIVRARVGAVGTSQTFTRWQMQAFCITTWAPNPAARDAIVSALDAALSGTRFIDLPDGQGARLLWHGSTSDDVPQREQLWKRELVYTIQYGTSQTLSAPQMLWGLLNLTSTNETNAVQTVS